MAQQPIDWTQTIIQIGQPVLKNPFEGEEEMFCNYLYQTHICNECFNDMALPIHITEWLANIHGHTGNNKLNENHAILRKWSKVIYETKICRNRYRSVRAMVWAKKNQVWKKRFFLLMEEILIKIQSQLINWNSNLWIDHHELLLVAILHHFWINKTFFYSNHMQQLLRNYWLWIEMQFLRVINFILCDFFLNFFWQSIFLRKLVHNIVNCMLPKLKESDWSFRTIKMIIF